MGWQTGLYGQNNTGYKVTNDLPLWTWGYFSSVPEKSGWIRPKRIEKVQEKRYLKA